VKRLMKEAQELRKPTEQYHAQPLEVNYMLITQLFSYYCVGSPKLKENLNYYENLMHITESHLYFSFLG